MKRAGPGIEIFTGAVERSGPGIEVFTGAVERSGPGIEISTGVVEHFGPGFRHFTASILKIRRRTWRCGPESDDVNTVGAVAGGDHAMLTPPVVFRQPMA